jgi:hypothetical protein
VSPLPDPNDIAAVAAERLTELTKQFEAGLRASAARDANDRAKREAAARRGELGPEWQKVQQRIDLNKTTLADVFSGADDSPEARALVRDARRNLASLGQELRAEAAPDDTGRVDPDNPFVQLQASSDQLAARIAALHAAGAEYRIEES